MTSYPPAQPPYNAPPPSWSGGPNQYYGPPPSNYLVWAILTTIFCCLPLGIVSIVFASQVNSKWAVGDTQGAYESSRKAKLWAIWSAVAALILGAGYGLLLAFGLANVDWSSVDTTY